MLDTGAGRDSVLCACSQEIWLFTARNSTEVRINLKPGKDLAFADALRQMSFDAVSRAMADEFIRASDIDLVPLSRGNTLTTLI